MYPKTFFAETELQPDPGLCYVVMPYADSFESVWTTIFDTVSEPPFNLLCRRTKDLASPGQIMTDVLADIWKARLVIAELTGQNPNVFYELGVAHTIKDASRVVLLAEDAKSIPFDLRSLRHIVYERDEARLRAELSATLTELDVRQYAISLEEGESGRMPGRLSGDDLCFYEVDIHVDHIGDDGVQFRLTVQRLAAGKGREEIATGGHYLGAANPVMPVPRIPWSLCYKRPAESKAHFILGRPQGWEPKA